ncbi:oxysterol-binding protein-related protein 1-like [Lineus longissimus]|uniref:oxysterol-binding protein-related protein 1-like n=1 Tax=Lineus longissimus TaxID=88925 RepID=UPI002B4DE20C
MEFSSANEELLYQARHGNNVRVTELLTEGDNDTSVADVNCRGNNKSNKGWTPLHLASYFGHYDVVKVLTNHGADVNVINDSGDTPLHKAAYTARVELVTLLLQHDADVSIINGEGQMAKHVTNHQEIRELIEATEDVEERKAGEKFISAARHGDLEKLAEMLKTNQMKTLNFTDKTGNTALHCAAYRGHKEVAVLLIQNGIDTSTLNMNGQSALELARDNQTKQILDVQPIKELKKNVKRFEGPLYRRSKFLRGWKGMWVVLERGVLSYFNKRADAATGVRRKSFKYLDDAKVELKPADANTFIIRFSDDTSHTLTVSLTDSKVTRQKWLNALNEHISYSTYYTKTGSNYVDEDMEDLLPLGSMQDALENSKAHQQILEKQIAQLQTVVNSVAEDRKVSATKAHALSQLRQELVEIVESSRDMCSSLGHCVTLFSQQEELRKLQLQQEMERSRVLQDALHVLATEHHELEQSMTNAGSKSPPKFYDTDDDEFYDCDDDEDSLNYSYFECDNTSIAETQNKVVMKQQVETTSNSAPSENLSKWKARMCLPVPMFSRNDFSVWSILRQCIGKELSKITMPVIFNEPLSFLQRITEYLEYATLIKKACDCDDPVERFQYVCAFAISASASNWDRLGKPFNPLLGETYELTREDLGFKIVCEQVSHHPPVSAFHVESPEFIFHGAIHPKLKFWGKSLEVQPKGTVTLELLRHGEVYTWHNINCSVHNIIVGKLWVEHSGGMEIINHTTKTKAVINFKPSGWFGRDLHKVEGYIYDKNKTKIKALYGKWVDGIFAVNTDVWENFCKNFPPKTQTEAQNGDEFKDCEQKMSNVSLEDGAVPTRGSACDLNLPTQQLLWQADERPAHSPQYYSFTMFAMMLNEMSDSLQGKLPPTDCRCRPDIRQLEDGNIDLAAEEKVRLEEKQRTARKERKKRKEEWRPRWFVYTNNPATGKEDWLFTGDYWARDWARSPDIF